MSSKIIIANFKSNKTREEYEVWLETFEKQAHTIPSTTKVVLAPPAVDLMFFANRLQDKKTYPTTTLGIQDISPFPAGAYTGAVSTRNLEGYGVTHAIIGHSERRTYFHETDVDIANKVRESLGAGITPIVCVSQETITSQANAIDNHDRTKVIVAFEPLDHIGTGIADSLDNILRAKELVQEAFGKVPYIYGGSVDLHTELKLLEHSDIDGFLVGSASLDPKTFLSLIHLVK